MTKTEFILELRKNLAVLKDEEIEDIVEEYEQHIDMKVQSGLTEEEAIEDFGSIRELCREILEAYHVKSDYDQGKARPVIDLHRFCSEGKKAEAFVENGARMAGGRLKKMINRLRKGLDQLAENVKSKMLSVSAAMKREKIKAEKEEKTSAEKRGVIGRFFSWMVRWIKAFVRWGIRLAFWCIRMIWNGFWICTAFFIGVLGLLALFFVGMLAVFLAQGYPVAGITMGVLGVFLCCGSVTGPCLCLIKRKKPAMDRRRGESDYEQNP